MLGNDILEGLHYKEIKYSFENGGLVIHKEYETVDITLENGSNYKIRYFCKSYTNKQFQAEYTFYIV